MTTFGLVHGGYHGAWCWEHLTPLLEQAGHGVAVMDLPLADSAATFETYADVVWGSLADCGDDVVLVGHSYAGNTIPLVAARRPLRHLVYLCAMIPRHRPQPGRAIDRQNGNAQPGVQTWIERARRTAAAEVDRPRHRARGVLRRLRRTVRTSGTQPASTPV